MTEIHHTSYAAVHEEPPVCRVCHRAMFTGLYLSTTCKDCESSDRELIVRAAAAMADKQGGV